jgi:hypothetical protein
MTKQSQLNNFLLFTVGEGKGEGESNAQRFTPYALRPMQMRVTQRLLRSCFRSSKLGSNVKIPSAKSDYA